MGGSGDIAKKAASRLGLPIDLIREAEGYRETNSIYPDNWMPVMVFSDCLTQWRVGAAGAIGLDYNVLPFVMDVRSIEDRADVFESVQVMERAALNFIRKQK